MPNVAHGHETEAFGMRFRMMHEGMGMDSGAEMKKQPRKRKEKYV